MLLGKHLSEIGNFDSNSNKEQCPSKETINQNLDCQSSKLSSIHPSVESMAMEGSEACGSNPFQPFQQGDQIEATQRNCTTGAEGNLMIDSKVNRTIDTEVKSSLLQKHLQEFNDLMKVQPKRHTENQLKEERLRQREEQLLLQQRELNSLRSQHSEQVKSQLITESTLRAGKDSTHYRVNTQTGQVKSQLITESALRAGKISTHYIVNTRTGQVKSQLTT
jgi:hypothetical protein